MKNKLSKIKPLEIVYNVFITYIYLNQIYFRSKKSIFKRMQLEHFAIILVIKVYSNSHRLLSMKTMKYYQLYYD